MDADAHSPWQRDPTSKPTGCFGSTSRKEPTSDHTHPSTSPPSRTDSTEGPDACSQTDPHTSSLPRCYCPQHCRALQRWIEPALALEGPFQFGINKSDGDNRVMTHDPDRVGRRLYLTLAITSALLIVGSVYLILTDPQRWPEYCLLAAGVFMLASSTRVLWLLQRRRNDKS